MFSGSVGETVKASGKGEERAHWTTDLISGVLNCILYPEEGNKFLNRTVIPVPNSITSQKSAVMLFVEFIEAVVRLVCTAKYGDMWRMWKEAVVA